MPIFGQGEGLVFTPKTLTLLVLIALGLSAALLVMVAMTSLNRKGRSAAGGLVPVDDTLRAVLEGHARALQRLEAAIKDLGAADGKLAKRMEASVQRVGLIRYDAFEDVGGRLSFSCALLDAGGNGVVITSINGRQDTRVYSKPVRAGQSEYNLSEEEVEAIREALAGARERVEAR